MYKTAKYTVGLVLAVVWAGCGAISKADGVALTKFGDEISYMIHGSGSPTLILVHGWTDNRTFWEPHISGLSAKYQVVTLDLASFGESLVKRDEWSMQSFASDVDAVLSALNPEKAVIVGFSMGGAPAIELATLGRENILGIVLVDIFQDIEWRPTDAFIEEFVERERRMWGDEDYLAKGFSEGASKTLVKRYVSRTPQIPPEVWWESIRQFFIWTREELLKKLVLVDVPIAAISSDRQSTNMEAWKRVVPDFEVYTMEDVGHLGVIWEKTDEFDQALIEHVTRFQERPHQEISLQDQQ